MSSTVIATQRQQHAITPSQITNRLHNICKHLTLGRQEDAHEFLRYLIEQMEKTFLLRFKTLPGFKDMDQYSKETTALNQILGGYLRSTVTCLSCKHESITFQHFMDLPLDISRVSTLNEALGGYFARENLEECGYKCESCKKKVSATKRFSLERAPVVLCIQLKRFNVMGGKLGKQITISQNLDLQKHLAKAGDLSQNCQYKLTSMVTHLGGSASGGHYTAIGLAPNGNYYHFDDSCVSSISTESALRTNAYVLFYELTNRKQNNNSNGHHILQNEHTYSKSASSTSTSSSSSSSSFDRSFAKPKLPTTMIPTSLMRQNNHLKQKENETTPPSSRNGNGPSTSKNVLNGSSKVSTQLFPTVKANGKREASDDEGESEEVAAKRMKPSLPSLPRLTNEASPLTPSTASPSSAPTTPTKPKSLVPYETDDEDDEPQQSTSNGVSNGHNKKAEADRIKLCRTSSGVFVETDLKENNTPSKQGSTIDKTVVTKASQLTNGSATNGLVNGKGVTNGYHVKRGDDAIQQLTKLNHSGYGTSEVVSWNNTPTNMNREVDNDQNDERKRQHEDEDDMEMDAGRVKKVKLRNSYPPSSGKLPNPFQEQQNSQNQNGNFRPPSNNYYDRPSNGYNKGRYQGNGGQNYNNRPNGNGKYGYQKPGSGSYGYQNGNNHNRNNNGNGKFNGSYKRYNNNNNSNNRR
jgi:ubiquitin carboxyl-terminal hydrolase 36/42